MKESETSEKSISVVTVTKFGEPQEEGAEPEKITIEIVDMRIESVMERRYERIMARTIRMRATHAQNEASLSNSHRITF